jgi:hypothetical protein
MKKGLIKTYRVFLKTVEKHPVPSEKLKAEADINAYKVKGRKEFNYLDQLMSM